MAGAALALGIAALAWAILLSLQVPSGVQSDMAHGHHGTGLGPFLLAWTVMMIAMMFPATAPLVALLARLTEELPRWRWAAGLMLFLATYAALWSLTGGVPWLLGHVLQALGVEAGLRQAGALLVAGIYQLTPAKRACLRACRSPLGFLMAHYRPGIWSLLRMGVLHGLACIGCCWAMMVAMALLVSMNPAVMAALAAWVALEKLLPAPYAHRLARLSGLAGAGSGLLLLATGMGIR